MTNQTQYPGWQSALRDTQARIRQEQAEQAAIDAENRKRTDAILGEENIRRATAILDYYGISVPPDAEWSENGIVLTIDPNSINRLRFQFYVQAETLELDKETVKGLLVFGGTEKPSYHCPLTVQKPLPAHIEAVDWWATRAGARYIFTETVGGSLYERDRDKYRLQLADAIDMLNENYAELIAAWPQIKAELESWRKPQPETESLYTYHCHAHSAEEALALILRDILDGTA